VRRFLLSTASLLLLSPAGASELALLEEAALKSASKIASDYAATSTSTTPKTIYVGAFKTSGKMGAAEQAASDLFKQLISERLAEPKFFTIAVTSETPHLRLEGSLYTLEGGRVVAYRLLDHDRLVSASHMLVSLAGQKASKTAASPVPIERSYQGARPYSAWTWAGIEPDGEARRGDHRIGFSIRTFSDRLVFDAGFALVTNKTSETRIEKRAGTDSEDTTTSNLTVYSHQYRAIYLHPVERIGIPGVYRSPLSGHIRIGTGFSINHVKDAYSVVIYDARKRFNTFLERKTTHTTRINPLVSFGMGAKISNALEASAEVGWNLGNLRYGRTSDEFEGRTKIMVRLDYRLF